MHRDNEILSADPAEPRSGPVEKRPYRAPALTRYGSVEELTAQEGTSPMVGTKSVIILTLTGL
jgi:hypothetical protein